MNKKTIVGVTLGTFSLLFVLANRLMEHLQNGIFFDLGVGFLLSAIWFISLNYIFKKHKIAGYDDSLNLKVDFYPIEDVADHALKYAVIMAKYNDQWLFCRHKDRSTWEIPGGRREPEEAIFKTAERELMEETGATSFQLNPVCAYSVTRDSEKSYGLLCYAEILELGNQLSMEIVEIKEFDELPKELTYPLIQPELYKKITEYLERL